MLSAFTARPFVELKQRDKFKIDSVLAYGDRLLVGLSTGSLRIYRVNEVTAEEKGHNGSAESGGAPSSRPSSSAAAKPVDLLRELEKFSTRAIEQLAYIKDANALISLSNGYVSIHDLQSYDLQEQLMRTKNATVFAVTSNIVQVTDTGILDIVSRLAVAVKRRLLLWAWHESELSTDVVEIGLSASIRSLTWFTETKIICGMNSGYVIVDVVSQEVEDIVGPGAIGGASGAEGGRFGGVGPTSMGYMGLGGYIPKPLATKLADGEMLLAKDINSLFIDSSGKPLDKRQVPWQQAPEAIGYSYPYMLALQAPTKGSLEVRNPDTMSLLQSITLQNATQLHFPPPTLSLAHAGKGFHVISERCVWRMVATNYDSQIDELVEQGRYDEAISILNKLEDALLRNKSERIREIKMLKAQLLFDQRKYRDSLSLFTEVSAPPERVIRLYPTFIAGELSTFEENISEKVENEEDVKVGSNGEKAPVNGDAIPDSGEASRTGLSMIWRTHRATQSDTASIRSPRKGELVDSSDNASIKFKRSDDGVLEGKDLRNAVLELNPFLVQTRTRLQRFLDPKTGNLISNLSNGQNGSSQDAFESLLMSPTSKSDPEREQKLRMTAELVDTTLFKGYMYASPSLAASLFRIPNFCDPDVVNEKLLENGRYNDLVDFLYGKKLHRPALDLLKKFGDAADSDETAPMLRGPQRTVSYLQNLPPEQIDLVLEYADWPLHNSPELGMEIFVADTENAERLPRERVLSFLQDIDIDLAVKYLEHIINELNDLTPDFHNRLVAAYLQDLKSRGEKDDAAWRELMEGLLGFLRSSKQYSLSKAFELIPKKDPAFYEAQAVVLSNMGQHKQALEIYVFKLEDYEKAEQYCNYVHLTQDSSTSSPLQSRRPSTSEPDDPIPSIYHTLLSLYLTPPPPHKPNWDPALSLLSKHGSRLPASSTLNLIPSSLPVASLESYFQGRIRAANSIVNEARIVAGLRKTEVVSTQAALLLGEGTPGNAGGRNRRVVITEDRVCGVCHKRLGGSVVAVLPNNSVVHSGCLNRMRGQQGASAVAGTSGNANTGGGMDALRNSRRAR